MVLEDNKLYVRIKCSICNGKVPGCPYCDSEGKHYIEASVKRIAFWLKQQSAKDKEKYKKVLEEV